jgi:hypothetical protein
MLLFETRSIVRGGIEADSRGTSGRIPDLQVIFIILAALGLFAGLAMLVKTKIRSRNSNHRHS